MHFNWAIDGSIVGLYLLATMVAGIMVRKYVGKVEHFSSFGLGGGGVELNPRKIAKQERFLRGFLGVQLNVKTVR